MQTKTQITVNEELALIISSILEKYPIFSLNKAVEFLIAKGSGIYLKEMEMSLQDLKDIQIAKKQIQKGQSQTANSTLELLTKLKN